jgi:hypothetical protein
MRIERLEITEQCGRIGTAGAQFFFHERQVRPHIIQIEHTCSAY